MGTFSGNPYRWSDPTGLAIGERPPAPPGYNPNTWTHNTNPKGRDVLTDPSGDEPAWCEPDNNCKAEWAPVVEGGVVEGGVVVGGFVIGGYVVWKVVRICLCTWVAGPAGGVACAIAP